MVWLDMRALVPHRSIVTLANQFDVPLYKLVRCKDRSIPPLPLPMWRRSYQPLPQDKSEDGLNDAKRWDPSTILTSILLPTRTARTPVLIVPAQSS